MTELGSRSEPAHGSPHHQRLEVGLTQSDLRVLTTGLPVTVRAELRPGAGEPDVPVVFDVVVRPESWNHRVVDLPPT